MKCWINKFQLLSWKELLLMTRTHKGILLVIVITGLGAMAQVLERLGPSTSFSCIGIFFSSYSNFLQFLPFALAIILADAISGEKERNTWNFFFSKPFTSGQVLLSKVLINYMFISVVIMLMWTVVFIFAQTTTSNCSVPQAAYILTVLLSITFTIVSLEIAISAFFKKVSVTVLIIIVGWIGLMVANMAVPIGRGFIAPWATNSFQTSVVSRVLGRNFYPIPFENLVGNPSSGELWQAVLLPLLQGLLLYSIAWIAIKRSTRV